MSATSIVFLVFSFCVWFGQKFDFGVKFGMQNYQKEALLGEGMFGVVYRARDKRTDVAVALKKSESHSHTLTLSHLNSPSQLSIL